MNMDLTNSFAASTSAQRYTMQIIKDAVMGGGGTFIGIQLDALDPRQTQVWFKNSRINKNTFVTINAESFQFEDIRQKVQAKVAESTATHEKSTVAISRKTLRDLADKLLKLSEEIDALYKEKK